MKYFVAIALLLISLVHVSTSSKNVKKHVGNEEAKYQTVTISSLIERSSSTTEAASLLRSHHDLKFLIENLEKHDVPFEQILIDLHHSTGERIETTKARGKCEPSSWKYYTTCMGYDKACQSDEDYPCQGLCRCNTVGVDECECVKSLSEPEREDDVNFFVKAVKTASDDMKETGEKIIKKADEVVDKIGDKISDVVDKGIDFVKKNVIDKIKKFLQTFHTASKHTVEIQKAKVQNAKADYYAAKGKTEKRAALLKLSHAIGKLNGQQQMVAIKNTLKKALSILRGAGHLILPDMLILGANYGSTLGHTAGVEHVYDFRTREIGVFTFGGINLGTNQLNALIGKSIGASAGVYLALGWQHSAWCKTLEDKYSGLFKTFDFSVEVPGFSIPAFASINAGGVAAVSASGLGGTLGKCCPLFSEIKTLGFSASASIGLGKSPIPFDAGIGCTDYHMKKIGKVCKESLLGFVKEVSILNVLAPVNLLLTVGLALANDFRAAPNVCGKNFKSPKRCGCQGLPALIECCGNRKCHRCDDDSYDREYRTIKQREVRDVIRTVRKDIVTEAKNVYHYVSPKAAFKFIKSNWKSLIGLGNSNTLKHQKSKVDHSKRVTNVCQARPLLKRGSKGKHVFTLQQVMGIITIDGHFGSKTRDAVKEYQRSHNLSPVDGVVGKKTWNKLCQKAYEIKDQED